MFFIYTVEKRYVCPSGAYAYNLTDVSRKEATRYLRHVGGVKVSDTARPAGRGIGVMERRAEEAISSQKTPDLMPQIGWRGNHILHGLRKAQAEAAQTLAKAKKKAARRGLSGKVYSWCNGTTKHYE